ncbi:hypothetical protein OPV22_015723 [Ensete ventricosum]|uniref:Uncharacterized protein n=1 Tax=Ensete ventricosum TaxID=4639 RepID=A0AAV8R0S2_ENSVE|nr:hypothetical protein OPV22_015723 [Ensete ventricosum]RWW06340.1 hypothetical protein GW17_00030341 [Ensete ventricosum]RWW83619.1 hypothetical protein BHE74_00007866 [Ensete ventricosum]RZS00519.1 hypothetical protein BHM03_00030230 [Ensete ventricosum]
MGTSAAVESPRGGRRRRNSSASPAPEFEFCIDANPSSHQPQLLTADELFSDGLLLPLGLLSLPLPGHTRTAARQSEPARQPTPPPPAQKSIAASASCSSTSGSKRWKDMFKAAERKGVEERKRPNDRRSGVAEFNIGIWPFSRSRSAGNATSSGGRPQAAAYGRKASSAPCSRSSSRGESSKAPSPSASAAAGGRKWAASPGLAGGVHVGRSSPVWPIRCGSKVVEPVARRRPDHRRNVSASNKGHGGGVGAMVFNLSVNTCIDLQW